MMILLFTFQCR